MTVFVMVFSVFFVAGISHSGSRLFSDVILICHHLPDLVHEVVGDAGGRVGPGAGQSVEASRGWVRGYILIQEVANIRETLTLQERNRQFPIMSKQRLDLFSLIRLYLLVTTYGSAVGVGVSIAVVLSLIAVTIAATSSVTRVLAGEQEKQERSQT